MHAQQIDAVLVDQLQHGRVVRGRIETDAHLDGEQSGHGIAQSAKQRVDFGGVAQQAAADVFLVNFWSRATHIEVDAGDGVVQQLLDGANHVGHVLADQLGKNRTPGFVFHDRTQNMFFRTRLGMNAKELGEKIVRRAVMGNYTHEWQIGDVLHGCKRGQREAGHYGGRKLSNRINHCRSRFTGEEKVAGRQAPAGHRRPH